MENGQERGVFVGLGSNLGDRLGTIASAIREVSLRIGPVKGVSCLYETEPVLHPLYPTFGQGPFLNGVAHFLSCLSPSAILQHLLAVELEHGRTRLVERPWGPRTLDLDLLAVGTLIEDTSELTLPHPRIQERLFVLAPLVELAPDWLHPILGVSAQELLQSFSHSLVPKLSLTKR